MLSFSPHLSLDDKGKRLEGEFNQTFLQAFTEGFADAFTEEDPNTKVTLIEGWLRRGADWDLIESATKINQAQFQALQDQLQAKGNQRHRSP